MLHSTKESIELLAKSDLVLRTDSFYLRFFSTPNRYLRTHIVGPNNGAIGILNFVGSGRQLNLVDLKKLRDETHAIFIDSFQHNVYRYEFHHKPESMPDLDYDLVPYDEYLEYNIRGIERQLRIERRKNNVLRLDDFRIIQERLKKRVIIPHLTPKSNYQ